MSRLPSTEELYEDAACGLLLTEVNGTIIRSNRTICAWLGRPSAEIIGVRFQSLLSVGGRIFHQTHWAPLLQMQGSLAEVKLELLHGDGRKLPMVLNAQVRRINDAEFHELALFSARDRHKYEEELLLARKRAEEHLRREQQSQQDLAEARARLELALAAAQLSQWSIDLPDRVRRFSPDVALLLGYSDVRSVDTAEFVSRIHPEDRDRENAELAAFLDGGVDRLRIVFRLIGVDGELRWVAQWGRMRFDDSGAPTAFVGVLQDVSDAHRLRALAEDRALLAEQTLGIVGHDLRNPLFSIQMSADTLARRPADFAQQQAIAARIKSSTQRAKRLIGDLLDLTQARNGRLLPVKKTSVDLHSVVREVVSELSVAFKTDLLRLQVEGDGGAVVDADRVAQAVGNLIANALTYGTKDRPIIVTSTGLPDRFSISVNNEGRPISPDLLPRIFEPLTRGVDPGQHRSVGLGLFIVREIAHAHGGGVECRSDAEGTLFIISLPRVIAGSSNVMVPCRSG